MRVSLIVIGDELLIGQVIDTNSGWIAGRLNDINIRLVKIYTVQDERQAIESALAQALADTDIVLTTGGLGPTKDDITKSVLSSYFGFPLEFHQRTWDRISAYFTSRGRTLGEQHKEQCYMPIGAEVLDNDLGTAPGMWFSKDGKQVIAMQGVPFEMKHIMEKYVLPRLDTKNNSIRHYTLHTVGVGETDLAERLSDFEPNLPEGVKLAYLPSIGMVRLRLSSYNEQLNKLPVFDELCDRMKSLVAEFVFGEGNTTFEESLGKLLLSRNLKLTTAESCTGGWIAHKITSTPGSSEWFRGGIIPYTNELKSNILGVPADIFTTEGAVSEPTVVNMVKGALKKLGGDIALATSGIAGPGGGTDQKPVGTVWIAVGDKDNAVTKKIVFNKDRLRNIEFFGIYAMNMVRKFIIAQYL